MEIRERVYQCLAQQMGQSADGREFKPTDELDSDLGLDSLDRAELTIIVEEAFGLELADDLKDVLTVGGVVATVEKSVGVIAQ